MRPGWPNRKTRHKPAVKGEWIHPDAQPVEELMHLAKSCPSGAISVTRNAAVSVVPATADSNAPPLVNTVRGE
jgi:hypothetical protein